MGSPEAFVTVHTFATSGPPSHASNGDRLNYYNGLRNEGISFASELYREVAVSVLGVSQADAEKQTEEWSKLSRERQRKIVTRVHDLCHVFLGPQTETAEQALFPSPTVPKK